MRFLVTWNRVPLWILAGVAAATAVASATTAESSTAELGKKVLEWIHQSNGGHVHPDQEFRVDPETGVTGLFATDIIPKGTVLCQVPWELIIKSDNPKEEGQMCCGTVKAVAREMKKGNESLYAPYMNYLNAQPNDDVPSAWSPDGQKLLRELVGGNIKKPEIPPTEPTEWLSHDWYKRCRGSRADALAAKAALMVLQRSDDAILIPGYDMYNHRNGKYMNTECRTTYKKNHVTRASRDIMPGEQIHNSYNQCKECSGRKTGYGSAEIVRDYGFLESFPRIFHYDQDSVQFELDVNEQGKLSLRWHRLPKRDDRPGYMVYFKRQIRRLQQIKNVNYHDGNPGIPEHEWNLAWEFQKANIEALTVAVASLEAIEQYGMDGKNIYRLLSNYTLKDFEADKPHYDELLWEFDDLDYITPTCANREIMKFHDHATVESIKTHYQALNFMIHPETQDVVMDLDDIVQISSNYRPQYHEYVTHAAARFVPKIQRVIFIGGGDSMLLHEVLKYPDLELVVGLELDQIVTRKCFKYFRSSPHFEDPRVEWWFGDATKSLLLLPEEYWQSFDLVLVDLSETVMSLSVTKQLDVFDALALLLKHDGVMVKNEVYMEPFSKVFDYTMDILYESPVICSQVLAFGSNKVDFMHDEVYDHGVHTLLSKNLHDIDTRHNFTHDYRINNATKQGKCGKLVERESLMEQSKSAGVVEIVEVEEVSAALDETLGDVFLAVIKEHGFSPLSAPVYETGMLMIPMKEGYVMARFWADKKYCNLDVNLWGSFHKLKTLRRALTDALGSKKVSQFKIVVGGMYGSETWKEDREIIGPKIVQTRDCSIPVHGEAKDISKELIAAAFDETMSLIPGEITAIVLCKDTGDCLATKLMETDSNVHKVIKLSDCVEAGVVDSQYQCEISTTIDLMKKLGNDKADLVVVDSSTSKEMVQIMNSVFSRNEYRKAVVHPDHVIMVWTMDAEKEEYQRYFLDRYRKQHEHDPQARAELWMQVGTKAIEFGLLKTNDRQIMYKISDLEANLKKKFDVEKNVAIELRGIYGGRYEFKHNWLPHEFLQSDYETDDGYKQYFEQQPLARHTIFQMEEADEKTYEFSKDALNVVLSKSLEAALFECTTTYSIVGMGEGLVMLCMNPYKGTVVMVWDGRKHMDISMYLTGNQVGETEKFMGALLHFTERNLKIALRDDMPRGINRVINFKEDLRTPEELAEFYEKLHEMPLGIPKEGNDDNDDDDDDDDDEEDGSKSEL